MSWGNVWGYLVMRDCCASAVLVGVLDKFLVSVYAKILTGLSGTRN